MIDLPPSIDINNLLDNLRDFSWEAYDVLIHYSKIVKDSNYESNILKNEDNENPVTIADLQVNELIIKRINQKYKNVDWDILSEENIKVDPENFVSKSDWMWVLDPLDGTKDFIEGTSNYAMHLALNFKRKPILGIVLIPDKEELWIGYEGKVWCEKKVGSNLKPSLSKNESLKDMVLVTSKNHRNKTLEKLIQKICFSKVIMMGSIGCKISSIIRGESDLFISLCLPGGSTPKDWDFAAPEALIKAAGGAITNIDNQELSYGKKYYEQGGIIVASNNFRNHEKTCMLIREIIEKNQIYPL